MTIIFIGSLLLHEEFNPVVHLNFPFPVTHCHLQHGGGGSLAEIPFCLLGYFAMPNKYKKLHRAVILLPMDNNNECKIILIKFPFKTCIKN